MFAARLVVLAAVVVAATPTVARAQCGTGQYCDVGQWAGPWEWNYDVCSSYGCPQSAALEFYHGALIPKGRYAGDVLLLRTHRYPLPNCTSNSTLESWLFRADMPAELLLIQHDVVPASMACAGES